MSSGNDEVDFALRLLTDELQKNATAAARDLEMVAAAMEKTGKTENEVRAAMKSLAKAEKEAGDAAKLLADQQGAAAKHVADAARKRADEHSSAMKRVGDASNNAEADLASLAVKGVASLAALALGAGIAAEKFALDAADFKTKTLFALETLEGSKGAAEKTLEMLRGGADALGVPDEKLTRMYTQLRNVGYAAEESSAIVSAAMDAAAGTNTPEAADHVMEAITKVARTGKFDRKAVKQALEGIGTTDELAEALSHIGGTKGLGVEQIKADMAAGKIAAGDGVNAILAVVQQKYDKGAGLGSAAKHLADDTVGGQMQRLHNAATNIFADTAVNGPFISMLKELNERLGADTATGKEIRKVLGDAFTFIGDAISKIKPSDIEAMIHGMAVFAEMVGDVGKAFGKSFGKALGPMLAPLTKFFDDSSGGSKKLELLTGALEFVGEAVGRVAGTFVGTFLAIPSALAGLYDDLKEVWDRLPHSMDELEKWWDGLSLVDVGSDLIDGLWEGIKASWRELLKDFGDLVSALPEGVKKILGIASPSKVMMELGAFTGEGFAEGIAGENDNAQRAMLELIAPPPPSPILTVGGGSSTSATSIVGSSFSIGELHVHVDGSSAGSPQDVAEAVYEVFRQKAREMGAIGEAEVAA